MNIPTGKNMFLWQIKNVYGGDPELTATRAEALGLSGVIIKILGGYYKYNLKPPFWTDVFIQPLADALHARGIKLYGFQYNYFNNGKREAEAAITRVEKFGLNGLFVDAEGDAKGKHTQARAYVVGLRSMPDDIPIGLCSYRFPSYHPELPWDILLEAADFHAPQVYWADANNPAEQLRRSVAELSAMKDIPFVPAGSAYDEHGWKPLKKELDEFDNEAQVLGLPGVCWWEWREAVHNDFIDTIAAHDWETPDDPPDPPDPPDDTELVARVEALEEYYVSQQVAINQHATDLTIHGVQLENHEETLTAHKSEFDTQSRINEIHADVLSKHETRITDLEDEAAVPDPPGNTIKVKAVEKVALHIVVGHDFACEGQKPQGKPILEPPNNGRFVYDVGATFQVKARALYSCKDDPNTPTIKATGNALFYVVADGEKGAGQFARADKVIIV